jgi:competence protein ComEC
MKQPLAGVAGLFAAGILIGRFWIPPLPGLFFGTICLGILGLAGRRPANLWLGMFLVSAGWTNLGWRTVILSPHDLRRQVHATEILATLRGCLRATPEQRWHQRDGQWSTNTLAVLICRAREASEGAWIPASGQVLISTPGSIPPVFYGGAEVIVSGVLRRPPGPLAPGLFDYSAYLRWKGIHLELKTDSADDWGIPPGHAPPPPGLVDRFQAWARQTLSRGLPPDSDEVRLVWAMTLGWKTGMTDEIEEPFMRSGTMHLFAISGLHIALIASITAQALRTLLIPRFGVGIVVLTVVWFYTAATGWQPSAIRATIMTSAVVGGWMLARPLYLLNSLAMAGWAILLWEPRQLFQAGFQLSFAVVGAMGLLLPCLEQIRRRIGAADPLMPAATEPQWRATLRRWAWKAGGLIAVSAAAWLGALPLSAHYFHLVTPIGLVANVVIVPLSAPALVSSLASLVVGPWSPALSELFNHSAWFWMRGMLRFSHAAAEVPGGWWSVREPPLAASILWYLAMAAIGLEWWTCRRWRIPLALCAALLGASAIQTWNQRQRTLRMVILPLQGGHAVWIHHRGGSTLVDTGDASAARFITRSFLRAQGVHRLQTLVLTHGDIRHVGGAPLIAREFAPARIVIGPAQFRSAAYRTALEQLSRALPGRLITRSSGDRLEGTNLRVRHPAHAGVAARADDACLVLDLQEQGARVLLLSDLSAIGQEDLLQNHPDLSASLVITGLPDRGAPADRILKALGTETLIVVDALYPATARASRVFKGRFNRLPAPMIFTSETGSLDLRWSRGGWRILNAAGGLLGPPGDTPPASR